MKQTFLRIDSRNNLLWRDIQNERMDGGYYGNIVIPRTVKYKNRTYRVTEIGERAFCYCDRVKSVKIPEGITRIGYLGVGYLKNIRSLYIPSSVKVLEAGCFAFNYGLSKVTVSKANKYYCSLNNCIYNKKKTALVLVCPKNRSYTFPSTVPITPSVFPFTSTCGT